VSGLKARGNFGVDVRWRDGKLTAATLRSELGNPVVLRIHGNPAAITLQEKSGGSARLTAQDGVFRFPTTTGTQYQITPE
jgi:alpha-L-fucosidase 2